MLNSVFVLQDPNFITKEQSQDSTRIYPSTLSTAPSATASAKKVSDADESHHQPLHHSIPASHHLSIGTPGAAVYSATHGNCFPESDDKNRTSLIIDNKKESGGFYTLKQSEFLHDSSACKSPLQSPPASVPDTFKKPTLTERTDSGFFAKQGKTGKYNQHGKPEIESKTSKELHRPIDVRFNGNNPLAQHNIISEEKNSNQTSKVLIKKNQAQTDLIKSSSTVSTFSTLTQNIFSHAKDLGSFARSAASTLLQSTTSITSTFKSDSGLSQCQLDLRNWSSSLSPISLSSSSGLSIPTAEYLKRSPLNDEGHSDDGIIRKLMSNNIGEVLVNNNDRRRFESLDNKPVLFDKRFPYFKSCFKSGWIESNAFSSLLLSSYKNIIIRCNSCSLVYATYSISSSTTTNNKQTPFSSSPSISPTISYIPLLLPDFSVSNYFITNRVEKPEVLLTDSSSPLKLSGHLKLYPNESILAG